MPLPFVQVLPALYPENFGGSSARVERFGFLNGDSTVGLPLGFTVTNRRPLSGSPSPLKFVGFSCVLCHSTEIRPAGGGPSQIIYGPGSSSLNLFAWLDEVQKSALDEKRFTVPAIIEAYGQLPGHPELGFEERVMLELWVRGFRSELKSDLAKYDEPYGGDASLTSEAVPTGPSRTQPFRTIIRRALDRPGTGMFVYTKIAAVFHENWRDWAQFDGSIHDLYARSAVAAYAAGATVDNLKIQVVENNVKEASDYTRELSGRSYIQLFPDHPINKLKAERGRLVYMNAGPIGDPTHTGRPLTLSCNACHGHPNASGGWTKGQLTEQLTPVGFIGTDPERVTYRYFDDVPDRLYSLFPMDHPFHFKREDLRPGPAGSIRGYVNAPIDSAGCRAPYLHNASVLTLAELINLKPRRTVFYRGREEYDLKNVGLIGADSPDESHYFRLETSMKGNSNRGHDYPWKADSAERDARQLEDLLEYLKEL